MGDTVRPERQRVSITVSGGTGTSEGVTINGRVDTAYIKRSDGVATIIDFEIEDDNGETRGGRARITTNALVKVGALCIGQNTIILSNALDGAYVVSLYWDFGV